VVQLWSQERSLDGAGFVGRVVAVVEAFINPKLMKWEGHDLVAKTVTAHKELD
jgi:hypothetical protein